MPTPIITHKNIPIDNVLLAYSLFFIPCNLEIYDDEPVPTILANNINIIKTGDAN
ncbi:MAG: hypothetical protein JJE21_03770 [Spirochaetaceae bacterium]|nr:hypothetical protein [Spirochaetaceae bacterium]